MKPTPASDRPGPDALNRAFADTLRCAARLPRIRLYPEERMRLAGSAFFEAPLLVEAVCRAVEDEPALFSALPFEPAAVRTGQERARLYSLMHAAFERLARHAHDLFLVEQAEATAQAMTVVRDGRCRLAAPCHTPAHGRLDEALRPAEEILGARAAEAGGGRGRKGRRGGRPRYRPDDLSERLRAAVLRGRRPGAGEAGGPGAGGAAGNLVSEDRPLAPAAAAHRSPAHLSKQGDPSMPPTPTPDPAPVTPQDIAGEAQIGAVRRDVADTTSALGLHQRGPEEPPPGTVLSANELLAAQAAARLLQTEEGAAIGEEAGVVPGLFQRRLETDVALCGLGRAAGRLEATAAIGEIFLGARLTEQVDRVLAAAEGEALPAEEREACATYLAGVDVIYERQEELRRGRRARAALRRERQAAQLGAAAAESEKLRARERLHAEAQKGRLP